MNHSIYGHNYHGCPHVSDTLIPRAESSQTCESTGDNRVPLACQKSTEHIVCTQLNYGKGKQCNKEQLEMQLTLEEMQSERPTDSGELQRTVNICEDETITKWNVNKNQDYHDMDISLPGVLKQIFQ